MSGVEKKRPRKEEEEVTTVVVLTPMHDPCFVYMYIARPHLGLVDRHNLSLVNTLMYGTFTRDDPSLHMMRGIWSSTYIRREDRLSLILHSDDIECLRHAWEVRIFPLPPPLENVSTKPFLKDASLYGCVNAVKFLLQRTPVFFLGGAVLMVLRGFCSSGYEDAAVSCYQNTNGSWYLPTSNPFVRETNEIVQLWFISIHACMHKLQAVLEPGLTMFPAPSDLYRTKMQFCIGSPQPVPFQEIMHQWRAVPADVKAEIRPDLMICCQGEIDAHTRHKASATFLKELLSEKEN